LFTSRSKVWYSRILMVSCTRTVAELARWSATGGVPGGWIFSVFVIDFSVRARGSPGGVRPLGLF
jgi:hypothetical protein